MVRVVMFCTASILKTNLCEKVENPRLVLRKLEPSRHTRSKPEFWFM